MLHENKRPAGPQHTSDFLEGARYVLNATKDQRADDSVRTGVWPVQAVCRAGPDFDRDVEAFRFRLKIRFHEWIRFDPDPANLVLGQIAEIDAGSRSDFQNGP